MRNQDFIYDSLPYLYTIGGVVTLLLSDETIGRMSGLLLVSEAMMVFHLRLHHRTERAEKAEKRLTVTQKTLAETRRTMTTVA
jgi:hypothetical protein